MYTCVFEHNHLLPNQVSGKVSHKFDFSSALSRNLFFVVVFVPISSCSWWHCLYLESCLAIRLTIALLRFQQDLKTTLIE